MRRSSDGIVDLIVVVLILLGMAAWIFNLVKLSDCDFKEDYRCEIIHSVGIIPQASFVTVWFDDDGV